MATSAEIHIENIPDLDKLLLNDSKIEKALQAVFRKIVLAARASASAQAQSYLKNDPRGAYKAVKSSVYRKVLGGSISLLNKRKRSGSVYPVQPQRFMHDIEQNSKGNFRGGNRRKRSGRTEQIMSYEGSDRAFILRFNEGTSHRTTRYGNRGSIAINNWFASDGARILEASIEKFMPEIEQLIIERAKEL